MRVANLKTDEQLRSLVRTLRDHNVVEEDDGMYHVEVTPENFKVLLENPDLIKVVRFMRPESQEAVALGQYIAGWYGALITPTWIIRAETKA